MNAQSLKKGTTLRHETYRIERVLGQGGFGITYLATDMTLDRLVAIKEFFPKDYCDRAGDTSHITLGTSSSSEFVSRLKAKFLKEARNIAKFDHPGIIRIHAAFEENNTAYYVMDYIVGESLSDKVKRNGPFREEVAKRYISEVAKALEYVHEKRINHLDVKPANIMVRESDDTPILIDFGLSKQYDTDGNQTSTTPTGISHGFAPLEQYNDGGVKEFSPQTDIYSLAATLFYLLTGIIPPHATKLIEEGINFPSNFPQDIKSAISIGMASARKNRFSSVDLFVKTLRNNQEDECTVLDDAESVPVPPNTSNLETPKASTIAPSQSIKQTKSKKILWLGLAVVAVLICVISSMLLNNNSENLTNSLTLNDSIAAGLAIPEVVEVTAPKTVTDSLFNTALGPCRYTGEVDEDFKPHGYGVAVWSKGDGKKYDGEWVHGNMDGQTTYTQRSGDTFVGTFKNNRYNEGRYTIISSGEYFEGTFKNGQPDKGNWYDKNGKRL